MVKKPDSEIFSLNSSEVFFVEFLICKYAIDAPADLSLVCSSKISLKLRVEFSADVLTYF